ncbi:MAG: hypothetical protein E7368_04565, partial [Clostridiales bacterium]|nr:hypothetical protein [Clostridiales bacterium]
MKRKLRGIVLALAMSAVVAVGVACGDEGITNGDNDNNTNQEQPLPLTQLTKPSVTVDKNGLATWETVVGAVRYAYKINGGEEVETTLREVLLKDGDEIRVKAIGDGKKYEDSSYCSSVEYVYEAPLYDGEINKGPVVLTLNALDTVDSATVLSG